jgi:hypothetical protein
MSTKDDDLKKRQVKKVLTMIGNEQNWQFLLQTFLPIMKAWQRELAPWIVFTSVNMGFYSQSYR